MKTGVLVFISHQGLCQVKVICGFWMVLLLGETARMMDTWAVYSTENLQGKDLIIVVYAQ
jgi:hypothetical protein